jgi:hypothetical protein
MYRSLYKMHETTLYGGGRALLGPFVRGSRPSPTVKLH